MILNKTFKIISKFIQWIFELFCLFILPGAVIIFIWCFKEFIKNPSDHRFFILGLGTYVLIKTFFPLFSRNQEVFWHEYTHSIIGLIFGKRIRKFEVTQSGKGAVKFNETNKIIRIAPYFIPILTVFLYAIDSLFHVREVNRLNTAIGFTFCLNLYHLRHNFSLKQPDLYLTGYRFSIIVVSTFFIVISTIVLGHQLYGWSGVFELITDIPGISFNILETLYENIMEVFE